MKKEVLKHSSPNFETVSTYSVVRVSPAWIPNSRNLLDFSPAEVSAEQDRAHDDDRLVPEVELDDSLVKG